MTPPSEKLFCALADAYHANCAGVSLRDAHVAVAAFMAAYAMGCPEPEPVITIIRNRSLEAVGWLRDKQRHAQR